MLTKAKMEADKVAEEARTNNQGMEGLQLEVVELESSISSQKMQVHALQQNTHYTSLYLKHACVIIRLRALYNQLIRFSLKCPKMKKHLQKPR